MTAPLVGFLGYGRMAQAISEGLDRSGLVPYKRQLASDVAGGMLEAFKGSRGIAVAPDNCLLAEKSPILIIAVKPHQVRGALSEIRESLKEQLVISIAAGVTLATLGEFMPEGCSLVRVIPNLPALVGKGVTLLTAPPSTNREDLDNARKIFQAVGEVVDIPESLFNEGTAISGSGPAYFFLVMEAMIRGAVRLGIPWEQARKLVVRTCEGAAATVLARPNQNLADLRDQVTSPGGTTAEGLLALEEGGLTALFHAALKAASDRGRTLS
ncbi:MAG: pyrroline-5-carboxylate reductase [Deltaproteobacteria bacterium]|jgi:pyrroline-5-carboxylate reductase|nr:pyrroline-5-carboxylate reductase [Deltaproteobacteria bacterium]